MTIDTLSDTSAWYRAELASLEAVPRGGSPLIPLLDTDHPLAQFAPGNVLGVPVEKLWKIM